MSTKLLPIKPPIPFEDLGKIDVRVCFDSSLDYSRDSLRIFAALRGEVSEGMVFDIGYANGIIPVLAVPEKGVPSGVSAG